MRKVKREIYCQCSFIYWVIVLIRPSCNQFNAIKTVLVNTEISNWWKFVEKFKKSACTTKFYMSRISVSMAYHIIDR